VKEKETKDFFFVEKLERLLSGYLDQDIEKEIIVLKKEN
jgi:hypothetical protein